jgi:hypothetical protein
MMRFRGGGVGHKSTRDATNFFKQDRDRLDMTNAVTTVTAGASEVSILDDDVVQAIDQDNDETGDDIVEEVSGNELEDEEDDYGYVKADSDRSEDSDSEVEGLATAPDKDGRDDISDQDLGPEDDAEAVDVLHEFGYDDL